MAWKMKRWDTVRVNLSISCGYGMRKKQVFVHHHTFKPPQIHLQLRLKFALFVYTESSELNESKLLLFFILNNMTELTEQELKEAKFYHDVYSILCAFTQWRQLPSNVNYESRAISRALEIIRDILLLNS